MPNLSQALKRRARDIGADLAGIASARPLPESAAYQDWVSQGFHAGMDYMTRNKDSREDIVNWYPDAKAVLLCAFSYADNAPKPAKPGHGRMSRYAVLPDYHEELKTRMKGLLEWFKRQSPGADGRVFVDTSPLLERLWARYAGLGWVGKNTMMISPKLGSYFFLTGLAVNIELEPDSLELDHCGSCRRCIDACPTEAFPRERVLDAGRCIAYFTIEHRGVIPEEFRPGVGDWVMGCDVCQEVCPWNRFARPGSVFKPQQDTRAPLEELAALDGPEFKRRFGKTPASRAKRGGIVRNALLAMGNAHDPAYRPTLEKYSSDGDPVLRDAALWSSARLPAPRKIDKL